MRSEEIRDARSNHPGQPVLSLILCSRNDQYLGNSLWRLETALGYVARRVEELGRQGDVEVLLSDWGSKVPLSSVLRLDRAAAEIVRFVQTPPELACELQKDSPFAEVLALNAAVRRARGEYIGRIDQDTLAGKHFLRWFFEAYEGRSRLDVRLDSAIIFSNRRPVPFTFASRCPSEWQVDHFVRWFGRFLSVQSNELPGDPFFYGPVGIWLLHRHIWEECGSYDERLIYWGWMEIDMIYRLRSKYKLVNLEEQVDCDFYHLEHYHPLSARRTNRKWNPQQKDNIFYPNSEDWGLSRYSLDVLPYPSKPDSAQSTSMGGSLTEPWASTPLLLWAAIQSVPDILVLSLRDVINRNRMVALYRVWRRRLGVARHTVRGQSMTSWPKLLKDRWHERGEP